MSVMIIAIAPSGWNDDHDVTEYQITGDAEVIDERTLDEYLADNSDELEVLDCGLFGQWTETHFVAVGPRVDNPSCGIVCPVALADA